MEPVWPTQESSSHLHCISLLNGVDRLHSCHGDVPGASRQVDLLFERELADKCLRLPIC